jgi:hypothetical protein
MGCNGGSRRKETLALADVPTMQTLVGGKQVYDWNLTYCRVRL